MVLVSGGGRGCGLYCGCARICSRLSCVLLLLLLIPVLKLSVPDCHLPDCLTA